jgi:hypothetical protein
VTASTEETKPPPRRAAPAEALVRKYLRSDRLPPLRRIPSLGKLRGAKLS